MSGGERVGEDVEGGMIEQGGHASTPESLPELPGAAPPLVGGDAQLAGAGGGGKDLHAC